MAAKVTDAITKFIGTVTASRGFVEEELLSELSKACLPTSFFSGSHGEGIVSDAATAAWRDALDVGDTVDFFHRGTDLWLRATVAETHETRGMRLALDDVLSAGLWVTRESMTLASSGTHTVSHEALLEAEPWRTTAKEGDEVDVLTTTGRFVPGVVVETSSSELEPIGPMAMSTNLQIVPVNDDEAADPPVAEVITAEGPPPAAAAAPDAPAAAADAAAAPGEDDGVTRFLRVVTLSSMRRSATVPPGIPWVPAWSLRVIKGGERSGVRCSFGLGEIPAAELGQLHVLLPSGAVNMDEADPQLGDGGVVDALRATPEQAVMSRGPGRSNGGTVARDRLRSLFSSGLIPGVLRRAAALDRVRCDADHLASASATRKARLAAALALPQLEGAEGVRAAADAADGDVFEGAAALVREALGAPEGDDAAPAAAPHPGTIFGVLRILALNAPLLNRHWAAKAGPAIVLVLVRALASLPVAQRRTIRAQHLSAIGATARSLLHRGLGLAPASALLELCTLELGESFLRQDLLQQRILGMKIYQDVGNAASRNDSLLLDVPAVQAWLDETEFFDIVFTPARSHEELFRRVGAVIESLLRSDVDATDVVDRLWEAGTGPRSTDESRQLCFEQLQSMAWDLNPEATAALLSRIASMPRPALTVPIVRLAVALVNVAPDKATRVGPMGLNLLWSLAFEPDLVLGPVFPAAPAPAPDALRAQGGVAPTAEDIDAHRAAVADWRTTDTEAAIAAADAVITGRDDSRGAVPPAVAAEAEEKLASLLKQHAQQRMKLPFCARALDRIKAGAPNGTKLLTLMWGVVSDCVTASSVASDLPRAEALERLDDSFGIVSAVLRSVATLHDGAKAHAEASGWIPDGGVASAPLTALRELGSRVCAWQPAGEGADYLTALRARVDFVMNACEVSERVSLSAAQARELYSVLVTDALGPQESEVLSRHLRSAAAGSISAIADPMTPDAMVELFRDAMCAESPRRMLLPELRALTPFFLLANGQAGCLDVMRTRPGEDPDFAVRKHPSEMIGFAYLWRLALEADDDEVGSRAVQFLSSLHTQFSHAFEAETGGARPEAVREAFVTSIVDRLRDAVEAGRWGMVGRCLVAAEQLLREADESGVAESGARPHGSLAARGAPLLLTFKNSIPAANFGGGVPDRSGDLPSPVSPKPYPGLDFKLRLPGAATVAEARAALGAVLSLGHDDLRLVVAGKALTASQNSSTLSQLGTKSSDAITVSLIYRAAARAPLLSNPGVSDVRDARLSPAAERIVADIFRRFSADGAMTYGHFRDFIRGAGVTKAEDMADARLAEIYKNVDCDPSGAMTVKGFVQFYTEACVSRATAVYSDFGKLGYDVATMTIPEAATEGEAESAADRKRRIDAANADRARRALEVRAMSRRILTAPSSGLHSALFSALAAPPEHDEAVVQRAWAMLLALPTVRSVLEHVGGGAESELLRPVEAEVVTEAPKAGDKSNGDKTNDAAAAAAAVSDAEQDAILDAGDPKAGAGGLTASSSAVADADEDDATDSVAEPAETAEPEEPAADAFAVTSVDLAKVDWSAELDSTSPFRLLYVLQILQMLAAEAPRSRPAAAAAPAAPAPASASGSGGFIGPLAPSSVNQDDGIHVRGDDPGGADEAFDADLVDTDAPADSLTPAAAPVNAGKPADADADAEAAWHGLWREQFIRSGGVARLLDILSAWDAESLTTVERVEGAEAASTADGLRRRCVSELFALAQTFVGPALRARAAATAAGAEEDVEEEDDADDADDATPAASGEAGTGADDADDDAASTGAVGGEDRGLDLQDDDAGSSSSSSAAASAASGKGSKGGKGGKPKADGAAADSSMSEASSRALVAQLSGSLGDDVIRAADPDRLVGRVLRLVEAAARAGTQQDVDIARLGLGLTAALAVQRPASLAPLLSEPAPAGAPSNWFGSFVTLLLLHAGSPSSARFRRFASINLSAMLAAIPDQALEAHGCPALADFLLDLLLARLDEVAEEAERAVAKAAALEAEDDDLTPARTGATAPRPDVAAGCVQYFNLLTRILKHLAAGAAADDASARSALEARLTPIATSLIRRVASHPTLERRNGGQQVDQLLHGVLRVLTVLVEHLPALRRLAASPGSGAPGSAADTFMRVVFEDCLFFQPKSAEDLDETLAPVLPKCKRPKTRAAAFALLSALAQEEPANVARIADSLVPVMDAVSGDRPPSSAVGAASARRAKSGYVGLRNLGCICYMNSMMQQLYMVPHFRFGVLDADVEVTDDDTEGGTVTVDPETLAKAEAWHKASKDRGAAAPDMPPPASDSVLYQLQRMYSSLSMSQRQDYDPRPWCNAFKDSSGAPVNVGIQQDAEEFVNQFLDKVERGLKGGRHQNLVRDCFTGTTVDQMCCPDVAWVREKRTVFHHLPLAVANSDNVYDSLRKSIEGEVMSDYRCDAAPDTPTDLHKRQVLGQLPDTMMLHFKRMVFDFDTFLNKKLNTRFAFPHELDLYAFTREGVMEDERLAAEAGEPAGAFLSTLQAARARAAQGVAEGDDDDAAAAAPAPAAAASPAAAGPERERYEDGRLKAPSDEYLFDLAGIVMHTGTAQAGHYFSFIRDRASGKWHEFNDSTVRPFDPKDIPERCFGGVGTAKGRSRYGFAQDVQTERTLNAYFTVYERRKPSRVRQAVSVTAAMHGIPFDVSDAGDAPFDPLARAEEIEAEVERIEGEEEREAAARRLRESDSEAEAESAAFTAKLLALARGAQVSAERVPPVTLLRSLLPGRHFSRVFADNARLVRQGELYSGEFFGFIGRTFRESAPALVAALRAGGDTDSAAISAADAAKLLDIGTDFALRVMTRSASEAKHLPGILTSLSSIYAEHPAACAGILHRLAADPEWIRELLLLATVAKTRSAVADLINLCMATAADAEVGLLWQDEAEAVAAKAKAAADATAAAKAASEGGADKADAASASPDKAAPTSGAGAAPPSAGAPPAPARTSSLRAIIDAMLGLMPRVNGAWSRFEHFWTVLLRASELDGVARFLVHRDMLSVIPDFLLGEKSPLKARVRPDGRKITPMGSRYAQPVWGPCLSLWSRLTRSAELPPHLRLGSGAKCSVARWQRKRSAAGEGLLGADGVAAAEAWAVATPPTLLPGSFRLPLDSAGAPMDEVWTASAALAETQPHISPGPPFEPQPLASMSEILVLGTRLNCTDQAAEMMQHLAFENPDVSVALGPLVAAELVSSLAVELGAARCAKLVEALLAIDDSLTERRAHMLLGDPCTGTVRRGLASGFPREVPKVDGAPPVPPQDVSASISRDFACGTGGGVGSGLLIWFAANAFAKPILGQRALGLILGWMDRFPAVAALITRALPPLAPSRHQTFGQSLIEFARWRAHTATMGPTVAAEVPRKLAIALYDRTRETVARHAAALGVSFEPLLDDAALADEAALLGWTQHLKAANSGFCIASGRATMPSGERVMAFRFFSTLERCVRVSVLLVDKERSETSPPNFEIRPDEPAEADAAAAGPEPAEAAAAAPRPETIRFLAAPMQAGVITVRPRIDPDKDFGLYDYNWKYENLFHPEAVDALPAARANGGSDGEFRLVDDAMGWEVDPDEQEALVACGKASFNAFHFSLADSGTSGGGGTSWRESEARRPADERLFDGEGQGINVSMLQLMVQAAGGRMVTLSSDGAHDAATRACPSCGHEFTIRELRCPKCKEYVGSA